jgi:hypothetical protein
VVGEVPDQALCSFVEIFGETYLGLDNFLEDFKWVIIHEGAGAYKHLINENAQTVPVHWLSMTLIHNDFRCQVFWSPTYSISSLALLNSLNKPKIRKF